MPTAELTRKDALLGNFNQIRARIERACKDAGRDSSEVEILAVTKYASTEDVNLLAATGVLKAAGENKVQDAKARWAAGDLAAARRNARLHFIGHLQTNKARAAVELFDFIDCIDSLRIAAELNRHAAALGKVVPVLIQLKLNSAETQSGIATGQAAELLTEVRKLENLSLCGYMGIAPAEAQPEELKKVFAEAKTLFDRDFPGRTNAQGFKHYLSLGMSGDYELAVAAGSNLPRIGSSLFA